MSAETVLTALSTILPAGTTIQQTLVEGTLDALSGDFPALLLFCPDTGEEEKTTGKHGETHTVVCVYVDRWESSTRTAQQLASDARTALEQMKANVRANPTLKVSGTDNARQARHRMKTLRLGIVEELEGQRLPFPMYAGVVVIEDIWDLWLTVPPPQ